MIKAQLSKALLSIPGFVDFAPFYIGLCNSDVISGYCLDISRSAAHVWRFLLPTYDNIEFLHLSLGDVVKDLVLPISKVDAVVQSEIAFRIQGDWKNFKDIDQSDMILGYIISENIPGIYPTWVRILTHIRNSRFHLAERELNASRTELESLRAIAKGYALLVQALGEGDWPKCAELIDGWSRNNVAKYSHC